ncbi:MAG: DNA helicase RecQ [Oscillospiraceae bacterium]
MDKFETLHQYFGFSAFREGQEYIIDEILKGKDVIGIMPTGAGKSICFQLPALMMEGITLVVSPLISLMKDQVMALKQEGVKGAYINSSLTAAQSYKAVDNMRCGLYKIVYVAPERLLNEDFLAAIANLKIDILAIDEAHCISQWGQDFRPSYTQIPQFIKALPNRPVIAAFTATATEKVTEDIIEQLELTEVSKLVTGFDRKNLYFGVESPVDKETALLEVVEKHKGESGIVYCNTRKNVEEVCEYLTVKGVRATRYHAGLGQLERQENQDSFIYDKCDVIVATNAFGMGIDKSNVRYVVHYNMPMDLESYYQEAGRAGRDGLPADCILLYGKKDVITNDFLINKQSQDSDIPESERKAIVKRSQQRLKEMTFYSTASDCLRHRILDYFGEKTVEFCGNCSSCKLGYTEVDITDNTIKILMCIEQSGQRFGGTVIANVLHGALSDQIRRWRLEKLESFGALSQLSVREIAEDMPFLEMIDAIVKTKAQYPVLELGSRAAAILSGEERVRVKRLNKPQKDIYAAKSNSRGKPSVQYDEDPALFEELRKLRAQLARNQGVPAFVVFSDATLHGICTQLPKNEAEFMMVSGVGQKKAEVYGRKFIALLEEYSKS